MHTGAVSPRWSAGGRVLTAGVLLTALLLAGTGGCRRPSPSAAETALATFRLPDGFRIEVAASEPEVQNPIAMAFDARGRLFVVELPDYPLGERTGRIKLLEDRDRDGRFETSRVFADGFHFPTGILPWKDGLLVTAAPDIVYIADTDGDGLADTRRVVLTGFAATNPQLRVNGLVYGLDNWIYVSYPRVLQPQRYAREFGDRGFPVRFPDHGDVSPVDALARGTDVRFRMDPPQLEPAAGNGQFGNAFDAWGNHFTVWNSDHIRHVVIQERYASANPHFPVPSSMQSISDHGKAAALFPITRDPLHIHESEIGHFTSASGISVEQGGTFPASFQGAVFVCDPVHNLVHADRLTASGATFWASRALEGREFLASTDGWFRPVFSTTGPDGALYIVDFHRKLVEHPEWLPPEMLKSEDIQAGQDLGRIYRVAYGSTKPAAARVQPADAPALRLVEYLEDANLWWRTTAQRLLVARGDLSAVPALQAILDRDDGSRPEARLHALWTLDGLGALSVETVLRALRDAHPGIREHAVRLAERYLEDDRITSTLLQMIDDSSTRTQFQVACTLGTVSAPEAPVRDALHRLALRHIEDPWFRTAVLTGAAESAGAWWVRLTASPDFLSTRSEGRGGFLQSVSSIIGSRGQDDEVEGVLAHVASVKDSDGAWWERSALDGLASGLRHRAADSVRLPARAQGLLLSLLQTGSPERRRASLEVVRTVRLVGSPALHKLLAEASQTAVRRSASADVRAAATGLLGLDPSGGTVSRLESLLSPRHPEAVQLAAAATLLSMRHGAATSGLLRHWQEYTGPVRDLVTAGFFGSRPRVLALVEALEAGTVKAASLPRARAARLRTYPDADIRLRAQPLLRDTGTSDRPKALQQYRAALKLTGDAERGRRVFGASCTACHRLGGAGFDVGPDVSGLSGRDRENLLLQIVDPNASITAGYEDSLIETTDGRSISGVIVQRTDSAVIVRRAGGGEDTILRSSIARIRSLALSHMPEGLEASMTLQDMADLLHYLKTYRGGS